MALKLLKSGQVSVDGLITHKFELGQTAQAIEKAAEKDSMKVSIQVS